MADMTENILSMRRGYELALPAGVIAIVALMILPVPPFLLDLGLAFSITASLVILFLAIYVRRPLEFATFPAVLLLTTLLRLGLNVASTRLILMRGSEGPGAAGEVIRSFGTFAVGGNYAVGFVVFLILVIINFVVITKGAGRIAEVAARFTLDAMPGKQLAIDADLNAGLIDGTEAMERRRLVSREADFHGAMDGASKFVRGDAIACILIAVINIVGGLIIGVFQHGMPIAEAARTYTLLTIGDGLVAQIPALIVSTAAGLAVSHVNADYGLGESIGRQFTIQHKPIFIASAVMFALGLIPGFAHFAFFALGAATAGMGYLVYLGAKTRALDAAPLVSAVAAPQPDAGIAPVDALGLDVGYGLIPLIDADAGEGAGELLERLRAIRGQFAEETGISVPSIRIRDNLRLGPTEYVFHLRGVEAARGRLLAGHSLVVDPGNARRGGTLNIEGIPAVDPAFGLPSVWVKDADGERARAHGYTVVSHAAAITTHVTEMIKGHAHELLGRQETQDLMNAAARTHPALAAEAVLRAGLGGIQKVLRNLLRERESIRDLQTILETLAEPPEGKDEPFDAWVLTECVRASLARRISRDHQDKAGVIHAIALTREIEDAITSSARPTPGGILIAMEPALSQRIVGGIKDALDAAASRDVKPVVLVSAEARRFVRRLVENALPALAVLSYNEIVPNAGVKTLKVVSL
ncbi:MAG: flagellar biosynthesis protein FlhA [Deltaproteobacteria bacterium]|nr:flagellar biosynthesis protein FlhA [Deltaproteobacteria bacterium]